ncbi:MAG TPA: acyltransferase [Clostridiaceae bacterium]|nr:acyltransferase [Clostridiaceae bacterium]
MKKYVLEVLRYMFSLSMLKSLIMSYAYYIHERVAWRTQIHAKKNIRVHPTASIRNAKNIYIGENSHININCCVWAGENSKIIIGDNLLMGPGVSIQAANHGTKKDAIMMEQERTQKDIVIGNDCWLGSNVTIVAGVTIPDGCIVGAGAVVTKSITEPYSIVGGVPAKVIGYRK